jgi:WD40 repeat protein
MFPRLIWLIAIGAMTAGLVARAGVKIEEQEVAPTGAAVKYAVSPRAVHLAAAMLQGSRHVVLIDGVPGPKFDDLIWIKGQKFEHLNQMFHHRGYDNEMEASKAPVVFSDDGSRFAYVGRQGNEFVVILDGKEFARGPFTAWAVQSLSFMPGGKRLCYILKIPLSKDGPEVTRFVIEGDNNNPPTPNLTGGQISFSQDGEHYAYFAEFAPKEANGWEPGIHLVVDGKLDPPQYAVPGSQLVAYSEGPLVPLFSGDSKHLITIRRVERSDPRPRQNYEKKEKKISVSAIFLDGKLIVEAPVSVARQQYKLIATPQEVSAGPTGQYILSVFDLGANLIRLFSNEQQVADVPRFNYIAWSPDGKRYAVTCVTDHQTQFMIIDGKKELEYKQIQTIGTTEYGIAGTQAFTADSTKSVYIGRNERAFLAVAGEESNGYAQIQDVTLSKRGAHVGFIATDDDHKQLLVVDGKALETRPALRDLTFTPDGSHYAAISGEDNKARKIVVDGIEQGKPYGSDFTRYSFSGNAGRDRHIAFSDNGQHFVYVSELAPTGQDGKPHRAVCLDGKAEIPCGGELINPFFTPDSRHLVWIAWDGYNVTNYSIYVDGKEAAHFDSPPIPYGLGGVTAKVGDFFSRSPDAAQMGSDGVLTLFAPVGNMIKKLRVLTSDDTSLATFLAQAEIQQKAAEQKEKEESTPSHW